MAPRRADHDLAAAAMAALADIRNVSYRQVVSPQVLTRVARLPTLLRTSGVLPTLAFHAAKGGSGSALAQAYEKVGVALRAQVCATLVMEESLDRPAIDLAFLAELTGRLRDDPRALSLVSARLEQFSMWLRRLAEALEKEQERVRAAEAVQAAEDSSAASAARKEAHRG